MDLRKGIIRSLKIMCLVCLLVLLPASAGAVCLDRYNADLVVCDFAYCPNGVITCAGCKMDAWVKYYQCIVYQASN